MMTKRSSHSCGIFKSAAHQGRNIVIAAGGFNGANLDSVEMLDPITNTWIEGKIYLDFNYILCVCVTFKKVATFWSSIIVINLDFGCNFGNFYLIAGPKLPKKLSSASLVPSPDGQGVILISGVSAGVQSSIYKLSCDQLECKWSEMEQQLQIARRKAVAMLIPNHLTNCTKF
jgi:hypothetical protein